MRPVTSRPRLLVAGALLTAIVIVVYRPVWTYGFVNFDDPDYVLDVPLLRHGTIGEILRWSALHAHARLWHPLTTLSHALDWRLWGDFAGGHHLTSVLLHATDAALLFAVLVGLTGAVGRSLAAALLWSLHPLRVESVAWVAERKDVLSGAGFLLTIAAYAAYGRRPTAGRYVLLVLAFAGALLAKSSVVTLPVILLLLDVWPLARPTPLGARLRAVLPLLAMAAATSIATIVVQQAGGAVAALDVIPLDARLSNAIVATVRYLLLTAWPTRLAVFYPYRAWEPATVAGAAVVLTAISALAWRLRDRCPAVAVGWAWYLLALLPVIGIIQAGAQSIADRFTYLPGIGLTIAVVWGVADLPPLRVRGIGAVLAGAFAVVTIVLTRGQLQVWRSSETLFVHALAVTEGNFLAHNNLGQALAERGDFAGAMAHYVEAARIDPRYPPAQLNLGNALLRERRFDEAESHVRAAVARRPDLPLARNSLGVLLLNRGRPADAVAEFERALALSPDYAEAEANLGDALRRLGRSDEAVAHLQHAVTLRPDWPDVRVVLGETLLARGQAETAEVSFRDALRLDPAGAGAHYGLGNALYRNGRPGDAVAAYREALRLRPDWPEALDNLGVALLATRDPAGAVDALDRAARLAPENPLPHFHLGVALAAAGRRGEAAAALRDALRLRPDWPEAAAALADVGATDRR